MHQTFRIPTRRESWLYAIANLGGSIPYQAFAAAVLFFYTDVKHLAPTTAAMIMTIYAIWNAANNPILGHMSDRTTSRWGRRIPYIRFGMIPYALSFIAIWCAPFDGQTEPNALAIWFLVTIVVFEGFGTAVTTAGYLSLLAEMFPTYRSRLEVAVRMNWLQTAGLFIGAALPPVLAQMLGYPVMGAIFGTIACLAYAIGLRGMFEQAHYQPTEVPFLMALKHTLINRSFVTVMLAQMMRFVSTGALTSGMFFYVKYSLHANPAQTSLILAIAFVSAGVFLPVWKTYIAHRFGARTTLMIAYVCIGIAPLTLLFVQTFVWAIVCAVVLGFPVAGLIMMGDVVMADVIDEDEMRTGARREGMFYAVNGAAIALSSTITAAVFGVIAHQYGYNPLLEAQPTSVDIGFRIYMTILPLCGAVCALIAMWFYPLHGAYLHQIRATLAKDTTHHAASALHGDLV